MDTQGLKPESEDYHSELGKIRKENARLKDKLMIYKDRCSLYSQLLAQKNAELECWQQVARQFETVVN